MTYGYLTADLVDAFVALVVDAGQRLGGSSDPRVIRQVARDALDPQGHAVISTALVDGRLVGAVIALVGGSRSYWLRFPARHPLVGGRMAGHRLREAVLSRAASSRRARPAPAAPGGVGRQISAAEDAVAVVPPAAGAGPSLRDHGADVAFGALALVAADQRGRGIGVGVYEQVFARLRERGITNYRGSIEFGNEASVRMCAALGFTIYRYPHGWFVSIDLAER
ncbi:MAG: GNAT family N-acetyltransferase [Acidimicrobiales bacterium]|nr:GNAT family N-acetyltransferase [Acidimicrobiales bacterium]